MPLPSPMPPEDATLTFARVPDAPLPAPPRPEEFSPARLLGGLALLAVPLVAAVFAYLLPTIRTIRLSRAEGLSVLGGSDSTGMANYDAVMTDGRLADGLAALAGPIGVLVLLGAVAAPLAAWLLHRAGPGVRTAARIVWGLAALTFVPCALTAAWLIERTEDGTREAGVYDWAGLIAGVVLGLGILAGLAAQHGRRASAVVVVAGLTAFAVVAAGLQTFAFGAVSGLPADAPSPVAQIYRNLYSGLSVGSAAAVSVLLLVCLAVLGLGAATLFLMSGTRIEILPAAKDKSGTSAAVLGVIVLVLLAAAVGYFLLPWLTRLAEGDAQGGGLWLVVRRTWGPPLLTTGVALAAAALGGFAIGAVRPLGGASRWLLLLFAPWLFVGSGPLGAANLEAVAGEGEYLVIGSYASRAWIAIPVLFVFTALFWGLENRRRTALDTGAPDAEANRAFASGAWPMAVLLGLGLLLVNAQDLFWQQLTTQDQLSSGAMIWALHNLRFDESGVGYGFPYPILALYAVAVVALAALYLPRVAIEVGRD